jgi:hypothetical protein
MAVPPAWDPAVKMATGAKRKRLRSLRSCLVTTCNITLDIPLLFATRIIRMFCYGFLIRCSCAVSFRDGLTEKQIGLLFTFTLAGDAGISLWLTTRADGFGRKRTLLIGAFLWWQPDRFLDHQ